MKGEISRLALKTCKSCRNYESTMTYMVDHHEHYSGPIFGIGRIQSAELKGGDTDVTVEVVQHAIQVLDSSGKVVRRVSKDSATLRYALQWTSGSWRTIESYVRNGAAA
jgi:hypothetical protein